MGDGDFQMNCPILLRLARHSGAFLTFTHTLSGPIDRASQAVSRQCPAAEAARFAIDDRAILLEGFFELIRRHGALAKLIVEEIRKEPNTRPRD